MKPGKYSHLRFGIVLGIGALLAAALCVQCVRTYWYTDAVLVPQQAEREAERQAGALTSAARSAGIADPRGLTPVIGRALESASDRVLWMRVLDPQGNVFAMAGDPQGRAKVPRGWWQRVEKHESLGTVVDTPQGEAFVAMLPLRMPPPQHRPGAKTRRQDLSAGPPFGRPPDAYVLELAIPLKAVAGAFDGLRRNLVLGLIVSVALLLSVAVIGLRAPHYFRGKYLERDLQLARRVQSDLRPKPHSITSHLEFAASAVAADHVGGDFYDVFEAGGGRIAMVLGDVSGKGVPAALLVSVLQGAIRSSTASQHESACERINRMLCERTAGERFATLFWGVFDPTTRTLRYVNAGHAAPMLIRQGKEQIERLNESGPVLGLLPMTRYSAGTVEMKASDTLVLYSDGINEATNEQGEEFGEERICAIISDSANTTPAELCERIVNQVTEFADAGAPQDDRTLLVIRFSESGDALERQKSEEARLEMAA